MNRRLASAIVVICALLLATAIGMFWGTHLTERGVERAIRRNFVAAGLLSQLQVAGEKMRRFEKEFFIYASVPAKRDGYAREFDAAYTQLLELLDRTLSPSNAAFTDAERDEILKWKTAAIFYASAFDGLVRRAQEVGATTTSTEQRMALTLDLNDRIGPGKDRFRELLNGGQKMREQKQLQSQEIASELSVLFGRFRLGVLMAGLGIIGATLLLWRGRAGADGQRSAVAAANTR